MFTKLKQQHDRGVGELKDPNALTDEQKQGTLPDLMFLKEKQSRKIKGQGCADG